jgi:hypothetical protein
LRSVRAQRVANRNHRVERDRFEAAIAAKHENLQRVVARTHLANDGVGLAQKLAVMIELGMHFARLLARLVARLAVVARKRRRRERVAQILQALALRATRGAFLHRALFGEIVFVPLARLAVAGARAAIVARALLAVHDRARNQLYEIDLVMMRDTLLTRRLVAVRVVAMLALLVAVVRAEQLAIACRWPAAVSIHDLNSVFSSPPPPPPPPPRVTLPSSSASSSSSSVDVVKVGHVELDRCVVRDRAERLIGRRLALRQMATIALALLSPLQERAAANHGAVVHDHVVVGVVLLAQSLDAHLDHVLRTLQFIIFAIATIVVFAALVVAILALLVVGLRRRAAAALRIVGGLLLCRSCAFLFQTLSQTRHAAPGRLATNVAFRIVTHWKKEKENKRIRGESFNFFFFFFFWF